MQNADQRFGFGSNVQFPYNKNTIKPQILRQD